MANVVTRMIKYLKTAAAGAVAFNAMDHDMVRRVFGGMASSAGKTVNEESASTLSAVWACWRIIAETVGSSPLAFYERDAKGNMTKVSDYPLATVLVNQPNADMTGVEYRETKALNLCQAGNTYSLKEMLGGEVVSLYPLQSRNVRPRRTSTGAVVYDVNDRGKWVTYPQDEVWHVKGFGGDGLVGLSPLSAAREAMGFALAAEEFGARFFAQGGKPSGVVTIPNFLTKDQRDIARENLRQMLGGMGNAHKFALFEGGMKPEPWGDMPLHDMEFLLLRQFSVPEICRFYRIPLHMAGDLTRATFSNIEQQSQEFVQYTMMPYFTRFEASTSRWLIPPKDRSRIFLRFNADSLLRGDSAGRAALWPVMLQNGVMTRNEVRAKENLNRVDAPEMDEYTVQSSMIRIDDLDAVAEAMRRKQSPATLKEITP